MERDSPSPYLLGLPSRFSMGLGVLRTWVLSPVLGKELETEGCGVADGVSSLTSGLDGSREYETVGDPPGFELLPLALGAESSPPAEPELSVFGSLLCSPSGNSCNETTSNVKESCLFMMLNTVKRGYLSF